MLKPSLSSRSCPVCATSAANAKIFVNRNIDSDKLSSYSFSSRKAPEFMSHQMVLCSVCDLVYVDEPPSIEALAEAYHKASYDSSEEANDAANSYSVAIKPILDSLQFKNCALEIGTGTGIFLEHLKIAGFTKLIGVEPSSEAIASAPEQRRSWIKLGIFNENDFEPSSMDLICCFMTMEHVRDPRMLTEAALRLLRPGGALVTVTHDYRSLVNKLLGKKSPIIDIEHMQIFSKNSISELLLRTGFAKVSVNSFSNKYTLRYWLRISPLPAVLKKFLNKCFSIPILRQRRLNINVGNIIAVGYRSL